MTFLQPDVPDGHDVISEEVAAMLPIFSGCDQ